MQGIGDELAHLVQTKRGQRNLMDRDSSLADFRQRPHERMRGAYLVVPVCTDEKEVSHFIVGDQVLEEIERRGVQPLEVVEEKREWVFWSGEDPKQPSEDHLKAVLCIPRRKLRHWRLFPHYEFKLGNKTCHELAVHS
jgi:hypothetical protein